MIAISVAMAIHIYPYAIRSRRVVCSITVLWDQLFTMRRTCVKLTIGPFQAPQLYQNIKNRLCFPFHLSLRHTEAVRQALSHSWLQTYYVVETRPSNDCVVSIYELGNQRKEIGFTYSLQTTNYKSIEPRVKHYHQYITLTLLTYHTEIMQKMLNLNSSVIPLAE